MPASDNSADHFRFLISCVKNSSSGKVDFAQVAEDLSIVSKAAAAKRYERMLKANGIASNGNNAGTGSSSSPVKSAAVNIKKASSPTKKRAAKEDQGEEDKNDKEEVKLKTKRARKALPSMAPKSKRNKMDGIFVDDKIKEESNLGEVPKDGGHV